jgi:hypothetical protein
MSNELYEYPPDEDGLPFAPTEYKVSDGDYIEADYTKFFNDIQVAAGYRFGEYLEICTDLQNDTIHVLGSNDEGDTWEWEQSFPVPQGWDIEQVKKMFEGYVYLEPDDYLPNVIDPFGDEFGSDE